MARHGFDAVEVFATRTHFDYRDDAAVTQLAEWLRETGLELHSVHAPIAEAVRRGEMVVPYSTASGDGARRAVAVEEAKAVLGLAARIPFRYLVLHLGVPRARIRLPTTTSRPLHATASRRLPKRRRPWACTWRWKSFPTRSRRPRPWSG